jgi:tetratricopeptide (TPR) repeat protein
MKLKFQYVYLFLLLVVFSCSTEKNTFISRWYHGTTAHYNGYFNANDLLNGAMKTYRDNLKEDYYSILPVITLPTEEQVKNMYTPIDTAIAKCTKVIQRHAMPSMDKPSAKKEEHNRWIDENWITIGIANFYRRDYELAFKNFQYTKKFFATDKSAYTAELWMARTYMEQGKFTEANYAISNLEKAQESMEQGGGKKSATKEKKSKLKKKKKKKKEKELPPFPKKLSFDLAITRAVFCEKKKDYENEIKALNKSLEYARKSKDKARVHYILGQLYEQAGDRGNAALHYKKVLKYNAGYEMSFNSNLKTALNSGGSKVRKNLKKMLRDSKNMEFKDQIYYTIGLMDQQEGNLDQAKSNYTKSAFYSTSNPRQKGMAYERLGDMSFSKKEYVPAQKYYDSCAKVIPQTYPNYEAILNKATKLQSLVKNLEIAQYEDSVQRIAQLSPNEQLDFAKTVLKKLKAEEEERKRQEEIRLAALQEIQKKKAAANPNGNKFYFNNEKTKQEGYDDFKKMWGMRENEDDWRRSDKIVFATYTDSDSTDTSALSKPKPAASTASLLDSLTPELLVANLPVSDSALELSRERMMDAYYNAGVIYYEQLSESALAEKQYKTILAKPFDSDVKMMAAFQIYKMHDPNDPEAQAQKDFILINYPTSDYAGYLRDPDYFIKKKEIEKLTLDAYLADLERYERGVYYPVIVMANQVIDTDPKNPYRSKYYLLKAHAQAKMTEDKKSILPTLDSLIAQYPNTPEAKRAIEMRSVIINGYSKNTDVVFKKDTLYTYEENVPMMAIIFLTDKVNNVVAKTRVGDFNKEYFGRERLSVLSRVFNKDNVIIVKDFPDEVSAAAYVSMYKKTRNHLLDMQKMKILTISQKNLQTLFETFKLDAYQLFYDEHY